LLEEKSVFQVTLPLGNVSSGSAAMSRSERTTAHTVLGFVELLASIDVVAVTWGDGVDVLNKSVLVS
jgi:hypothetical protein